MPEPTAPDTSDDSGNTNPKDITNSPYKRHRSAREEEVGGIPDPETTRRIRESLQQQVGPGTVKEEVVPATQEQRDQRVAEGRERLRITRIPKADRTPEEQAFLDKDD